MSGKIPRGSRITSQPLKSGVNNWPIAVKRKRKTRASTKTICPLDFTSSFRDWSRPTDSRHKAALADAGKTAPLGVAVRREQGHGSVSDAVPARKISATTLPLATVRPSFPHSPMMVSSKTSWPAMIGSMHKRPLRVRRSVTSYSPLARVCRRSRRQCFVTA